MFYCCGFSVRRSNFFLFLVCLSFSFIFIILVLEISYHVMVRVRAHNLVVGLFMRIWWPIGINFKIFSKTLNLCLELEVRFPIAIQRFKIMQPNIALICHSFFFFFSFSFGFSCCLKVVLVLIMHKLECFAVGCWNSVHDMVMLLVKVMFGIENVVILWSGLRDLVWFICDIIVLLPVIVECNWTYVNGMKVVAPFPSFLVASYLYSSFCWFLLAVFKILR